MILSIAAVMPCRDLLRAASPKPSFSEAEGYRIDFYADLQMFRVRHANAGGKVEWIPQSNVKDVITDADGLGGISLTALRDHVFNDPTAISEEDLEAERRARQTEPAPAPKRKGGWPAGKKRKPAPQPEPQTEPAA